MDTLNPTISRIGEPTQNIVLVVAIQPDLGIGKEGTMPWHIPEDLRAFRESTENEIVVMGRKTRDSLSTPNKLLPNRVNVIITRSVDKLEICQTQDRTPVVYYKTPSLEAFLEYRRTKSVVPKTVFVIGGSDIYNRYRDAATHALVTKLDRNLTANPDRFFFDIDQDPTWFTVKTEDPVPYRNGQQSGTYVRQWYRHFPPTPGRGKLIVVEGLDGSGKDTQIQLLQKHFDAKGLYSKVIRELDGNTFTQDLARALLNPASRHLVRAEDEFKIWSMVRAQTQPMILEALNTYDYVIMNRYIYSFLAMQGGANHRLFEAYQAVHGFIRPDFIVFLDRPVGSSLSQAKARGALDRFELQDPAYHEAIRDSYNRVLESCSVGFANEYLVRINANRTIDEVHQDVVRRLRV